eukprot:evm.model.scf_2113.1 EVM.evm.TU.scf_2113.1   scf_2113:5460-11630(+)
MADLVGDIVSIQTKDGVLENARVEHYDREQDMHYVDFDGRKEWWKLRKGKEGESDSSECIDLVGDDDQDMPIKRELITTTGPLDSPLAPTTQAPPPAAGQTIINNTYHIYVMPSPQAAAQQASTMAQPVAMLPPGISAIMHGQLFGPTGACTTNLADGLQPGPVAGAATAMATAQAGGAALADRAGGPQPLQGAVCSAPTPITSTPIAPATSAPAPRAPGPSTPGPSAPGPSAPGPSAPAPRAPEPSAPGPSTPGPSAPGPSCTPAAGRVQNLKLKKLKLGQTQAVCDVESNPWECPPSPVSSESDSLEEEEGAQQASKHSEGRRRFVAHGGSYGARKAFHGAMRRFAMSAHGFNLKTFTTTKPESYIKFKEALQRDFPECYDEGLVDCVMKRKIRHVQESKKKRRRKSRRATGGAPGEERQRGRGRRRPGRWR